MKNYISIALIFLSGLCFGQVKFSVLPSKRPASGLEFLIGQNNAAGKVTFDELKDTLSPKLYPYAVTNVLSTNNSIDLRNKYVRNTGDSLYYIRANGDAVLLNTSNQKQGEYHPQILSNDNGFLSKINSGKLNIALISDSNGELDTRLGGELQKEISSQTGLELSGIGYVGFTITPPLGCTRSSTGTWATSAITAGTSQKGISGDMAVTSTVGSTYTFNIATASGVNGANKAQSIKIYSLNNSAVFTYSVDGGGAVTVTTNSSNTLNIVNITGLSDASHSIVITHVSGALNLYGVAFTRNSGYSVHRLGKSGSSAFDWANLMKADSANFKTGINDLGVNAIVYNLGHNDLYFSRTPTQFMTDFRLLSGVLTKDSVSQFAIGTHGSSNIKNTQFIVTNDSLSVFCREKRIGFYSVNRLIPDYVSAVKSGLLETDSIHYMPILARTIVKRIFNFSFSASNVPTTVSYMNKVNQISEPSNTTLLPNGTFFQSASSTGAIKITLPTMANGSIIDMELSIRGRKLRISGTATTGAWTSIGQNVEGYFSESVRFCFSGSSHFITIGELTTGWGTHLSVIVEKVHITNTSTQVNAVTVSLETSSFGTVSYKVSPNYTIENLSGSYATNQTGALFVKTDLLLTDAANRRYIKGKLHVYELGNIREYEFTTYANETASPNISSAYMTNSNSNPTFQLCKSSDNYWSILIGGISTAWVRPNVKLQLEIFRPDGGTITNFSLGYTVSVLTDLTGLQNIVTPTLVEGTGQVAAMAIGATSPATSAILDIISTTKGVIFPRMTGAQRDAISSPVDGMVIYNTTTAKLQVRAGGAWVDLH